MYWGPMFGSLSKSYIPHLNGLYERFNLHIWSDQIYDCLFHESKMVLVLWWLWIYYDEKKQDNEILTFKSVWETKFLEHSPENRCPLYVLYKIPLAQANFLLIQLKMHSHW